MTVDRLLGTPNQFFDSDGIRGQLDRELNIRVEKRSRDRARMARGLHDTLFQVFFAASMLPHNVAEPMPVRSLERRLLGNALRIIRRVLEEGRSVLQDPGAPEFSSSSIEQELSGFLSNSQPGLYTARSA